MCHVNLAQMNNLHHSSLNFFLFFLFLRSIEKSRTNAAIVFTTLSHNRRSKLKRGVFRRVRALSSPLGVLFLELVSGVTRVYTWWRRSILSVTRKNSRERAPESIESRSFSPEANIFAISECPSKGRWQRVLHFSTCLRDRIRHFRGVRYFNRGNP